MATNDSPNDSPIADPELEKRLGLGPRWLTAPPGYQPAQRVEIEYYLCDRGWVGYCSFTGAEWARMGYQQMFHATGETRSAVHDNLVYEIMSVQDSCSHWKVKLLYFEPIGE